MSIGLLSQYFSAFLYSGHSAWHCRNIWQTQELYHLAVKTRHKNTTKQHCISLISTQVASMVSVFPHTFSTFINNVLPDLRGLLIWNKVLCCLNKFSLSQITSFSSTSNCPIMKWSQSNHRCPHPFDCMTWASQHASSSLVLRYMEVSPDHCIVFCFSAMHYWCRKYA